MTTTMQDLVDPDDLDRAIADRLVNFRMHPSEFLQIFNYSDLAMYTPGAWDNPAVRACRGLIVDPDTDVVVARPWSKFFNYGQVEAGALDLDAPVEVTDKMDGSLGIVYPTRDGGVAVATRGSFVSDQAKHATELIQSYTFRKTALTRLTVLVEIVYPGNRIVCDYGDLDELVLLGGVDIETGDYIGPEEMRHEIGWEGPVTETFPYATLAEALAAEPRKGAEGMCVRYLNRPHIVKIKQDDYIALHKIVTGLSEKTVWEHLCSGEPIETLLDGIPDELHQWVYVTWFDISDQADAIETAARIAHNSIVRQITPGFRKEYAALAGRHPSRPYLFMLLDGRDPRPAILKSLKPSGDTRFKVYTEDVA